MSLMSLSLVLLSVAASVPYEFYVAVDGDNNHPGTLSEPFATVDRAQEAVRERIAQGLESDVIVHIRGGVYYLDAPLAFTAADGGNDTFSVTYQAYKREKPVFSGGQVISNWERSEDNRWTATITEVASGEWHFRQLFRGADRLPRARYPKDDGLMRVASVDEAVTEIHLQEPLPAPITEADDAELVVYQNWSITRVPIVSAEDTVVRTSQPAGWIGHGPMTTTSPDKPAYVENVPALLGAPGEWYLDRRTGVLTYQALRRENPRRETFIAPRLEVLLKVAGTPDTPVRNLRFRGLAFTHAAWPLPEFGYRGIQAGHFGTTMEEPTHVLPGAVQFVHTVQCALLECRVAHTGASGIVLGAGCRENKVAYCTVEDIGGNGIMVGWRGADLSTWTNLVGDYSLSADWAAPELVPTGNSVSDCTVRRCGAVNLGCVGIYDAFCDGTTIQNNLVSDLPYSGISIGFRWDTEETSQRNCAVINNHVHDVMKMLADGAAIYTLGYQPGTALRGNLLHDIHRSEFAHGGAPNNGIFFDQGSKGYLVEGNIIYNASGNPTRFNQTGPENLVFGGNFFGIAPSHPNFPRKEAAATGPR